MSYKTKAGKPAHILPLLFLEQARTDKCRRSHGGSSSQGLVDNQTNQPGFRKKLSFALWLGDTYHLYITEARIRAEVPRDLK